MRQLMATIAGATVGLLIALAGASGAAGAAGLRWSAARPIDRAGGIPLSLLACPSSSECEAVDGAGRLVGFDPASLGAGVTTLPLAAAATSRLSGLACPSAGQCTVIDADGGEATLDPTTTAAPTFVTVDSGAGTAGGLETANGLACPSTALCVLVDGAGNVVAFDPDAPAGATVTSLETGEDFGLLAVACPSTTQCTAISQTREWTFDPMAPAGAAPVTIDSGAGAGAGVAFALACASATQCTAVDQSGRETTFDPQAATPGEPVALSHDLYSQLVSVACPSSTVCVAADTSGYLTSFDPVSGAVLARPAASEAAAVACPTPGSTACVAVDGRGDVLVFTAGRAATPVATRIDAGIALVALACPANDRCTALDSGHELTFDPLLRRPAVTRRRLPGRAQTALAGLDCPTTTLCSAVRIADAISFDPRRFAAPRRWVTDHDGDGSFVAVRCPARRECVAIDSDGAAVTYDPVTGAIVRRNIDVEEVEALTALACPSRAQCTATDNDGSMITFDPLTGRRLLQATIDPEVGLDAPSGDSDQELDAIACPTTSACVAADTLGNAVRFDPRTRRGAILSAVDPGAALTAAACPSLGRCVLVDSLGRALTGRAGGGEWTTATVPGAAGLTAVDCPTSTECIAVDGAGDAFTARNSSPTR